jgi:hypothetical protein
MLLRSLTPASRRQDHTTSPSAVGTFVKSAARVHRIPPRVRDDRDTPLMWDETAGVIEVIWVRMESEYFCEEDWTASISLIRFNKLGWARRAVLNQKAPQQMVSKRPVAKPCKP